MYFCILGLFLAPAYAIKSHYSVNTVKENGKVYSYIDLGFGHSGTWIIWGHVWRDGPERDYQDSGHVYLVFSRYWGYGANVDKRYTGFDSIVDI